MRNSTWFLKLSIFAGVLFLWTNASAQKIELVESISCPGDNNGELTINPGSGSYTYKWVNTLTPGVTISTKNTVGGLVAGTYQVTVDDGVTPVTDSYTLSDPDPIINTPTITANSNWPNNNGIISIVTTGGTGQITYQILDSISRKDTTLFSANIDGNSSAILTSLASGDYFITTSDKKGCSISEKYNIAEDASSAYGEVEKNNDGTMSPDTTACYKSDASTSVKPDTINVAFPITVIFDDDDPFIILGFRSGTDTVNINYGTAGTSSMLGMKNSDLYITEISTVTSGPSLGLDSITESKKSFSKSCLPGFHICHVYTANGKGFRYSWDVDSVVAPVSINYIKTDNLCFDGKKGSFTATAQGSYQEFEQKYTYSVQVPAGSAAISGGTALTISGSNLVAGDYVVTATDWAECVGNQTIRIEQPDDSLYISYDVTKMAKCPYSSDGEVTINRVVGGTAPFKSIIWDGDSTNNEVANSLTAGMHSVIVIDNDDCRVSDSIFVNFTSKSCFYNIVTPNGDGYNDYFDLTDMCQNMQMEAKIFNEYGKLVTTLDETNPKWDAYDPSTPPTGPSSTYTAFIKLTKDGVDIAEFGESFSVIYSK